MLFLTGTGKLLCSEVKINNTNYGQSWKKNLRKVVEGLTLDWRVAFQQDKIFLKIDESKFRHLGFCFVFFILQDLHCLSKLNSIHSKSEQSFVIYIAQKRNIYPTKVHRGLWF